MIGHKQHTARQDQAQRSPVVGEQATLPQGLSASQWALGIAFGVGAIGVQLGQLTLLIWLILSSTPLALLTTLLMQHLHGDPMDRVRQLLGSLLPELTASQLNRLTARFADADQALALSLVEVAANVRKLCEARPFETIDEVLDKLPVRDWARAAADRERRSPLFDFSRSETLYIVLFRLINEIAGFGGGIAHHWIDRPLAIDKAPESVAPVSGKQRVRNFSRWRDLLREQTDAQVRQAMEDFRAQGVESDLAFQTLLSSADFEAQLQTLMQSFAQGSQADPRPPAVGPEVSATPPATVADVVQASQVARLAEGALQLMEAISDWLPADPFPLLPGARAAPVVDDEEWGTADDDATEDPDQAWAAERDQALSAFPVVVLDHFRPAPLVGFWIRDVVERIDPEQQKFSPEVEWIEADTLRKVTFAFAGSDLEKSGTFKLGEIVTPGFLNGVAVYDGKNGYVRPLSYRVDWTGAAWKPEIVRQFEEQMPLDGESHRALVEKHIAAAHQASPVRITPLDGWYPDPRANDFIQAVLEQHAEQWVGRLDADTGIAIAFNAGSINGRWTIHQRLGAVVTPHFVQGVLSVFGETVTNIAYDWSEFPGLPNAAIKKLEHGITDVLSPSRDWRPIEEWTRRALVKRMGVSLMELDAIKIDRDLITVTEEARQITDDGVSSADPNHPGSVCKYTLLDYLDARDTLTGTVAYPSSYPPLLREKLANGQWDRADATQRNAAAPWLVDLLEVHGLDPANHLLSKDTLLELHWKEKNSGQSTEVPRKDLVNAWQLARGGYAELLADHRFYPKHYEARLFLPHAYGDSRELPGPLTRELLKGPPSDYSDDGVWLLMRLGNVQKMEDMRGFMRTPVRVAWVKDAYPAATMQVSEISLRDYLFKTNAELHQQLDASLTTPLSFGFSSEWTPEFCAVLRKPDTRQKSRRAYYRRLSRGQWGSRPEITPEPFPGEFRGVDLSVLEVRMNTLRDKYWAAGRREWGHRGIQHVWNNVLAEIRNDLAKLHNTLVNSPAADAVRRSELQRLEKLVEGKISDLQPSAALGQAKTHLLDRLVDRFITQRLLEVSTAAPSKTSAAGSMSIEAPDLGKRHIEIVRVLTRADKSVRRVPEIVSLRQFLQLEPMAEEGETETYEMTLGSQFEMTQDQLLDLKTDVAAARTAFAIEALIAQHQEKLARSDLAKTSEEMLLERFHDIAETVQIDPSSITWDTSIRAVSSYHLNAPAYQPDLNVSPYLRPKQHTYTLREMARGIPQRDLTSSPHNVLKFTNSQPALNDFSQRAFYFDKQGYLENRIQQLRVDTDLKDSFVELWAASIAGQRGAGSLHALKRGLYRSQGTLGSGEVLGSLQMSTGIYVFTEGEKVIFHAIGSDESHSFPSLRAAEADARRENGAFAQFIDASLGPRHVHSSGDKVGFQLEQQAGAKQYLSDLYPQWIDKRMAEVDANYRSNAELASDRFYEFFDHMTVPFVAMSIPLSMMTPVMPVGAAIFDWTMAAIPLGQLATSDSTEDDLAIVTGAIKGLAFAFGAGVLTGIGEGLAAGTSKGAFSKFTSGAKALLRKVTTSKAYREVGQWLNNSPFAARRQAVLDTCRQLTKGQAASALTRKLNAKNRSAAQNILDIEYEAGSLHATEYATGLSRKDPSNPDWFVTATPKEIYTLGDLKRVPRGYRVAFVSEEGKMIHAMISRGNGRFSGTHNDALDPSLGQGFKDVDLVNADGSSALLDGALAGKAGKTLRVLVDGRAAEFRVTPKAPILLEGMPEPNPIAASLKQQLLELRQSPTDKSPVHEVEKTIALLKKNGYTDIQIRLSTLRSGPHNTRGHNRFSLSAVSPQQVRQVVDIGSADFLAKWGFVVGAGMWATHEYWVTYYAEKLTDSAVRHPSMIYHDYPTFAEADAVAKLAREDARLYRHGDVAVVTPDWLDRERQPDELND